MKKESTFLTIMAVALSFVGSVVGAGFISGQELVQFFIRFGVWGFVGWFLVVAIVVVSAGFLLEKIAKSKPESFDKIVEDNFSGYFSGFVNLVVNGYLIGGLIIMISGAGSIVADTFSWPLFLGVGLVSLAIFFTIIGKGERILVVSRLLVPLLIFSTVFVAAKLLITNNFAINLGSSFTIKNPSPILFNWVLSVIFYLGYNAIGAVVAVINIGKEITPKVGRIGGRLGGMIVGLLGTLLIMALWVTYPAWQNADLPILLVLKENFTWLTPFYVPAMIIAMYTVATAYALGLSKFMSDKFKFNFISSCAGLLVFAFPLSLLGFSRLLGMVYPFFGIMATIILVYVVGKVIVNKFVSKSL